MDYLKCWPVEPWPVERLYAASLPEPPRRLNEREAAIVRGHADSIALKLACHDPAVHRMAWGASPNPTTAADGTATYTADSGYTGTLIDYAATCLGITVQIVAKLANQHTFVVRRILLWQAQGVDVDQAMLSLSTYVGHAMVTNTYWYLSAVPELMAVAAQRFDSCMPEVDDA